MTTANHLHLDASTDIWFVPNVPVCEPAQHAWSKKTPWYCTVCAESMERALSVQITARYAAAAR